ncbi:TonB-dependent receptor [Prevotella sp. AM42-24]|uniref:TonB-dependent receptor n=1 Tax=Prevotella sp. AM42-24 TaxID=2293125 RepID=UPI000E49CA48|nr:TonB-dependent receptor [Prevotella sp. AM42-24]RGH46478.1 TonB-dependent receptor [Prevotella sp. AM42-24]
MKKSILMMLLLLVSIASFAQERLVSGAIIDRDTKDPVEQVTVQLLKTDSTYVTGAISNEKGLFHLNAPGNGKYLLKITSVGYKPTVKRVVLEQDKNLALGNVVIGADAIMLKGAVVTAMAQKVTLKEDTFVYNSAAYRTPEGSVVEELVKRLPGAEVSDDGTIKINGKEVKKILVDGKEFMTGDTKTALKNLPTSIIDKIKAYDEKSDLSKVTGIDDGEEQTVLDFNVKKGMNKGLMSNIDLAIGNKDRYSARGMGGYFNSNNRFMLFGNANNTSDRGFGGGGPRRGFGGGNGLNASKMLAANYNYEEKNKIKFNTSLRWNHGDGDVWSRSASENFMGSSSSFSNSLSQKFSRSDSWNGNIRLEWMPDTMTNILFRPSISWTTNDSRSTGISASYNQDPYQYTEDPLSDEGIEKMDEVDAVINRQKSVSLSNSKNNNIRGMLQLNRKLNNKGRNVTLRMDAKYTDKDSKSISLQNAHLYLVQTAAGLDSTYQTNRYNLTPSKDYSYSAQATYSEPLWKATFLQLSYKFTYSYSKSDRSTYDFSKYSFDGINPEYGAWGNYLGRLDGGLGDYRDDKLSRYSEYRNYTHDIQVMMRFVRQKYNLNFGVMIQPQRSKFIQDYQGKYVDTVRTVTNVSPTLDFRYRFSKMSNLRVNYRGTTSQPSISQLLNIVDDSDPLNVSIGNPGLKPSFTQNFRLFYNNFVQNHNKGVMTYINFSTTSNSISNKVTYDETTGGRITRPENINGNWNVMGAFMFNCSIDSAGVWNINTDTNLGYNHYVSYLSLDKSQDSQKNTTQNTTWNERLSLSYRNDWLELSLDGTLAYNHAKNKLQPNSNLDTWQFSYGPSMTLTAPWGTSLNTSLSCSSRRGYSDASMNTDEFVWNAQLSQGFLKGKPLTVMLQFYDLLHQQSTFSRAISSVSRTDTEYNAINSYAMLHVVYRMNLFGGKDARKENRGEGPGGRPDFRGRPFNGSGRPMGPPPGRFF